MFGVHAKRSEFGNLEKLSLGPTESTVPWDTRTDSFV
jgi:hypothetical protein